MLARVKLVSNLFVECFMFGVAGLVGLIFIPVVIAAAWLELFKETKNEFINLDRPVPHAEEAEELDGKENEPSEEV